MLRICSNFEKEALTGAIALEYDVAIALRKEKECDRWVEYIQQKIDLVAKQLERSEGVDVDDTIRAKPRQSNASSFLI